MQLPRQSSGCVEQLPAIREKPHITVGIATSGRRDTLTEAIALLAQQHRLPDSLVICPVAAHDVDDECLKKFPAPCSVVSGPVGLPAQRNRILAAAASSDVIVFFDDDFFPDSGYLQNLEELFDANPDVVGATGYLLADGAKGPGLSVQQGLGMVRSAARTEKSNREFLECYGAYGCNMAFRMETIRNHRLRFDENLPLYGWQEDIDFSQQVILYGRIAKSESLRGVHLGIKLGRTSGVRFGYSQIANPAYLIRKGTMSWKHAFKLVWRNIAANLVRSIHPEPWVDRRGRLKGNALAMLDIVFGRSSPGRILQLD